MKAHATTSSSPTGPAGIPTAWIPSRSAREAAAYAEAGVHHVVSAPWRSTVEEWVDSMEQLTELVPFDPAE